MTRQNIILVLSLLILFVTIPSYASTKTETRTEEDLKISDDIEVTEYNTSIILNTPKVDETEKIYDFADLFTEEEETALYENVMNFINKTNLDMIILTISENSKYSAQDYADDFYDYNYFGVGDNHDGILFLIDMDTREIYISTEGLAINIYTNSRINRMLDSIYNQSPLDNPYSCANKFIETAKKNYYSYKNGNRNAIIGISFIIAFLVTFLVVKKQCDKHKTVKIKLSGDDYLDKNSINITLHDDVLVNSYVKRDRIEHYSGGGPSGGSSTHHSSSGRSHGGGGRRF